MGPMKVVCGLVSLIGLMVASAAHAQTVMCPGTEPAVQLQIPDGWKADATIARRLGVCAVFEKLNTDFDSSPAIIYPNIVPTSVTLPRYPNGSVNLTTFINDDVASFRAKSVTLRIRSAEDIATPLGDVFVVRDFLNGPPPNEFEESAYLAVGKAVLVLVLSARSEHELQAAIPSFRRFVSHTAFVRPPPPAHAPAPGPK